MSALDVMHLVASFARLATEEVQTSAHQIDFQCQRVCVCVSVCVCVCGGGGVNGAGAPGVSAVYLEGTQPSPECTLKILEARLLRKYRLATCGCSYQPPQIP